MFPREELTELAQRKTLLQAHIGLCRVQCRVAAVGVTRPLMLVDRGVEIWRRISPFAKLFALPAGLLVSRFFGRGRGPSLARGRGGSSRR